MMTFRKYLMVVLMFLLFSVFLFRSVPAQDFLKMNDQQWIELAIDMIRKGVQQQDTSKIAMVSAPSLFVKQQRVQTEGILTRKFQDIFNSSGKRKLVLRKPLFKQPSPLNTSNFWDFDIVNLKVKIIGDSAIADCELVLWAAPPAPGSKETGRRMQEKFIFKSPPQVPRVSSTGQDQGTFGNKGSKLSRSWQLVRFENLMDFLRTAGEATESHDTRKEGK